MLVSYEINVWLPILFGAFGGFLFCLHRKKSSDIEMPHFKRFKVKGLVFKPGFLGVVKEIAIGSGSGFIAGNAALVLNSHLIMVAFSASLLAGFSGGKYLVRRSAELTNPEAEKLADEIEKFLSNKKDPKNNLCLHCNKGEKRMLKQKEISFEGEFERLLLEAYDYFQNASSIEEKAKWEDRIHKLLNASQIKENQSA